MKAVAAKGRKLFQGILFATDFSPAAAQAIPYIKKIAQYYQSHILALHVRPPAVNPVTVPGAWPADTEAQRASDNKHRKEVLQAFEGIPTHVAIEEGDMQSCLADAIQNEHMDLAVIGTRGRAGLGKLLLGSVAEEIFRTVNCPVLTVGPHSDASKGSTEGFREILYATNFGPEFKAAAEHAVSLAEEFQARLILLHVVPEPKPGDLVSWSDVRASARELLGQLVPPEAEAWCKPEYFIEQGDPAERILDLANLRDVDLIVLGARPEKGVPGAASHLPFAVAHKVVSRARCPVLTVRST